MRHFKRAGFIFAIVSAFVLMAGCTPPQRTDDGLNGPQRDEGLSQGATFYVYSGGHGKEGHIVDVVKNPKWQIPLVAVFTYSACMKDRATAGYARGQKFEIEIPKTSKRIVPDGESDGASDAEGCIKWHEEMPFPYFARRSAPILITRYIVGTGVHTGKALVKFYVDPWAIGNNARDYIHPVEFWKDVTAPPHTLLNESDVTHALDLVGREDQGADLWVSQLDVKQVDRQDFDGGSKVDYEIRMNPMVEWYDNDGLPQYTKLNTGYFEIVAHLVATDAGPKQDQKVILTESQMSTFAPVRNGELITTLSTVLRRDIPIGNVAMVIKLIPRGIEGSRPLKTYEAIYDLGDVHGSLNPGRLIDACVNKNRAICSMTNFLKNADNFSVLKASNYARDANRLSFGGLKLRFVTVAVTPPETATQRTVSYSASTCITDRRTGNRVANMPFHVEYVDLDDKGNEIPSKDTDPYQKQDLVTDDEGCLRWLAHIWHQYYKPEHYFVKHVKITMGETSTGTTLHFILNPWDDKFTFGFDQREVSKDFVMETVRKIKSRFFTGGYGYHTLRFMYNFDKFMNLEVKKTILLEVDPRVLRYSGIVNARRTTEGLRDGIYLLKVAIEKNYFDPATPGLKIDPNPKDPTASVQDPPDSNPKAAEVPKWGYVNTATSLVRVVDGRLIKPVELSMHDLRLMRMRSNFLIELETVDEQKVAANKVFQDNYKDEIKKIQEYRDAYKQGHYKQDLTLDQFEQKMDQRATETQDRLKKAWDGLSRMLSDQKKVQPQNTNLASYQIPEALLKPLESVLGSNDFTETKLPSCENTDCERFIEHDSGLDPRTFVGPIIFLSNAYSDAVRPTDNLDEACDRPDNPFLTPEQLAAGGSKKNKDYHDAYASGPQGEEDWFGRREGDEDKYRTNLWYKYNRYYGSLSHLCYKSVDDLINQERVQSKWYKDDMEKIATIDNFVQVSNVDFLKLNPGNDAEYRSDKNLASPDEVVHDLNDGYFWRANHYGIPSRRRWTTADLGPLFNGNGQLTMTDADFQLTEDQIYGFCNLFANRARDELSHFKPEEASNIFSQMYSNLAGANAPIKRPDIFADFVFYRCVQHAKDRTPSIRVDERVKVYDTGVNYKFNGGLQLNLNVGEGFSVSNSGSYSKSLELSDLITSVAGLGGMAAGWTYGGGPIGGGVLGAFLIHLIRPLSGKGSASLSDSDGTNVSSQTYLVAQIAKFDVELTRYERCMIYRLDPRVLDSSYYVDMGGIDPNIRDDRGRTLGQVVTRGIMVCDGKPVDKSQQVPEDYYWFTQHFTEGDMLDQADLLNHPWLMGLRGDRDFGLFINTIKAQEAVTPSNLGWGLSSKPPLRPIDWPLEQLAQTYRSMPPSFPGFYTVLRSSEKITSAPLNGRIIPIDKDINGEVCNRPSGCVDQPQMPPPNRMHTPYEIENQQMGQR